METIKVPLTGKRGKEKFALIDAEDVPKIIGYSWGVTDKGYARRSTVIDGKTKNIRMHHAILQPPKGMVIDHINHDKLDNRKCNLRAVTAIQNNHNRKRGLRYYYYDKSKNVYKVVKNRKHYGSFKTEAEARALGKTLIGT